MWPKRAASFTIAVLALLPWAVRSAAAADQGPKVMLEATLDAADETPRPTGTLPGAEGTATFEYDETNKSIRYTVTVQNLTGPPVAAHIHQAPPGTPGPIRITLDQNNLGGGAPALPVPPDLVEPLFDGGTYVNVHTSQNPNGEIRGQIGLKPGLCSCSGSAAALRQCVKQAIKSLDRAQRKSAVIRSLKRDVKKSSCGRTSGPKNAVACRVREPSGNIVTDQLCLPVSEAACTKLGGTSSGAGTSCFPGSTQSTTTTTARRASTTTVAATCVTSGGRCTRNSQCCSGSCYLGSCY